MVRSFYDLQSRLASVTGSLLLGSDVLAATDILHHRQLVLLRNRNDYLWPTIIEHLTSSGKCNSYARDTPRK
jgi:hypothetical protein